MTINDLQVFSEVYQRSGISAAARALHMSQPAVSRIIQTLEKKYQIAFFSREGHKLIPTDAGKIFFKSVSRILQELNAAASLLLPSAGSSLTIAAVPSFAESVLSSILSRYMMDYPDISFLTIVDSSSAVNQLLQKNEPDLAVTTAPPVLSGYTVELLYRDELQIMAASSLDIPAKIYSFELEKYPLILRNVSSSVRKMEEEFFLIHGLHPNIIAESSNISFIVQLASKGCGLALLPEGLAKHPAISSQLKSIRLMDASLSRDFFVATKDDSSVQCLCQKLKDEFRGILHS